MNNEERVVCGFNMLGNIIHICMDSREWTYNGPNTSNSGGAGNGPGWSALYSTFRVMDAQLV